MKKNTQLSVIIPAKNEQSLLPRVVGSIRSQKIKNVEIILADANSTDNTRKVAKKLGLHIVPGGYPDEGKNIGARYAKSDLLLFLDADVTFPSKVFLKKSLEEFRSRRLEVAGTYLRGAPAKNALNKILYGTFYAITNFFFWLGKNSRRPFIQSCMFVSRRAHKKIGGFPPYEFGEDSAYAENAVKRGLKFGLLTKPGKIILSNRRFEKKGFFRSVLMYLRLNLRRIFGHEYIRGKNSGYWS